MNSPKYIEYQIKPCVVIDGNVERPEREDQAEFWGLYGYAEEEWTHIQDFPSLIEAEAALHKILNTPSQWVCESFDTANGEQFVIGYYSKDVDMDGQFNEVAEIVMDYPEAKIEAHAKLITLAPEMRQALEDIATAGERHGVQWDAATMGNVARALLTKLS